MVILHTMTNTTDIHILKDLLSAGTNGLTWRELQVNIKKHHGTISGSLSNLHKAGDVYHLKARRGNCHIYVHQKHIYRFEDDKVVWEPRITYSQRALKRIIEAYESGEDLDGPIREAKSLLQNLKNYKYSVDKPVDNYYK